MQTMAPTGQPLVYNRRSQPTNQQPLAYATRKICGSNWPDSIYCTNHGNGALGPKTKPGCNDCIVNANDNLFKDLFAF